LVYAEMLILASASIKQMTAYLFETINEPFQPVIEALQNAVHKVIVNIEKQAHHVRSLFAQDEELKLKAEEIEFHKDDTIKQQEVKDDVMFWPDRPEFIEFQKERQQKLKEMTDVWPDEEEEKYKLVYLSEPQLWPDTNPALAVQYPERDIQARSSVYEIKIPHQRNSVVTVDRPPSPSLIIQSKPVDKTFHFLKIGVPARFELAANPHQTSVTITWEQQKDRDILHVDWTHEVVLTIVGRKINEVGHERDKWVYIRKGDKRTNPKGGSGLATLHNATIPGMKGFKVTRLMADVPPQKDVVLWKLDEKK